MLRLFGDDEVGRGTGRADTFPGRGRNAPACLTFDSESIEHVRHRRPPRPRTESLARQHHSRLLDDGTLERTSETLGHRPDRIRRSSRRRSRVEELRIPDPELERPGSIPSSSSSWPWPISAGRPISFTVHAATAGIDGWVSLEVSPLLANDTDSTIAQAKDLHARAAARTSTSRCRERRGHSGHRGTDLRRRPDQRDPALQPEHYLAAAEAYTRHRTSSRGGARSEGVFGGEPVHQSMGPGVGDSWPARRWRTSSARDRQAVLRRSSTSASDRWSSLRTRATPQRLLFASTGTKDPSFPTPGTSGLAAPDTVNTMPEKTLLGFHEHGSVEQERSPGRRDPAGPHGVR